jgi:hypothetical protein
MSGIFVQIAAEPAAEGSPGGLYALDVEGVVWMYQSKSVERGGGIHETVFYWSPLSKDRRP